MDFDKLWPHRFLKAGDFAGRDVTLKIIDVKLEELEGQKGKETKAIIFFEGTKKQLVLNKTNGLCIKAMFGRETDAWLGKRITFFPAPIQFEDAEICIRVRGSPDLAANVTFELKLARKKPRQVTLYAIKPNQKPQSPASAPKQAPAPSMPEGAGEGFATEPAPVDPPGLPDNLPMP